MNAVWTDEDAERDERMFELVAFFDALVCITALAAIMVSLAIIGGAFQGAI